MKSELILKILSDSKKYGNFTKDILLAKNEDDLIKILYTGIIKLEEQQKSDFPTKETSIELVKSSPSKTLVVKKEPNKADYILEFQDIEKSFGKNKVHQGVSFNVERGETLALIGANGAGKTVLMETLVRVQHQDKGVIKYNFKGIDPFEEIGMQFQDADSNTSLTPKHMINFIKKMYPNKVNDEQLEEMINVYGISDYLNRKIKKLSGGQKQRVNLLLATMHNPSLMILDEFITGLDVLSVRDILNYIQFLKEKNNSTLIIISHQPEEIKQLADRVIILKNGTIQEEQTVEQINQTYGGNFTDFLLEKI